MQEVAKPDDLLPHLQQWGKEGGGQTRFVRVFGADETGKLSEGVRAAFRESIERTGWRDEWRGCILVLSTESLPHASAKNDFHDILLGFVTAQGWRGASKVLSGPVSTSLSGENVYRPDVVVYSARRKAEKDVLGAVEIACSQTLENVRQRAMELFDVYEKLQLVIIIKTAWGTEYFADLDANDPSSVSAFPLKIEVYARAASTSGSSPSASLSSSLSASSSSSFTPFPLVYSLDYEYPNTLPSGVPPIHLPVEFFLDRDAVEADLWPINPDRDPTASIFPLTATDSVIPPEEIDDVLRQFAASVVRHQGGPALMPAFIGREAMDPRHPAPPVAVASSVDAAGDSLAVEEAP
ncbi:hypothetical protein JCM11251_007377 [Rhodosporidiobolus azoricus]